MDTITRQQIIILDIEGVLFKTRISTLISVPGGYFARILGKDWSRLLDKDGRLFLDRDATVFPVILNFLRDGNKIPLPSEEYFLQRIRHEANYYGLLELVERIDRILPGKPMLIKELTQKPTSSKTEIKNGAGRRRSSEDPILPTKSDSKVLKKTDSITQISLPKNFAHVAHVGWNGDGMIFEKHLLGDEEAVRKIIQAAAQNADDTPIYNVINGASEEYGSHSIEV
ncbi:unnamed protein product, partial [Mesorhabditis belari]|uniref:CRIB domain-containing protein n=1 Tax=Mesorhabditis belari TaxID=2138241 RepID=A0AAF3FKX5_9BILA